MKSDPRGCECAESDSGHVSMAEESVLQTARRGDVLGLEFGPHDRVGWQDCQHAEHSR